MAQDFIENPFLPEGKFFWGDDPVEDPTASPCGELYQKHAGQQGHQLLVEDFEPQHQKLLQQRIQDSKIESPVLMNKNPNLIVRLPWLKKMFPTCTTVVVLREPVANIYSFSKKLHLQKQAAADFWWGVKPKHWENFINPDPLIQIVAQWKAVFHFLLEHINNVDVFINYKSFCENPQQHLQHISNQMPVAANEFILPFEKLTCMDEEFKSGGSLDSKNILLRREKTFEINSDHLQDTTYPPFSEQQIAFIRQQTAEIWDSLENKIQHSSRD